MKGFVMTAPDIEHNNITVTDEILGVGSNSMIYLGFEHVTGKKLAVKVIKKGKLSKRMSIQLKSQLQILKHLSHPNICSFICYTEDDQTINLAFEYLKEDLLEFVVRKRELTEQETIYIMKGVADALQYLHSQDIVHHDLKLENIMIITDDTTSRLQAKIIDFDFCCKCKTDELLEAHWGTEYSASPELRSEGAYRGKPIDIYAFGVICFTCLAGRKPFLSSEEQCNAFDDEFVQELICTLPKNVSSEMKELIARCMDPIWSRRPTADDIVNNDILAMICVEEVEREEIESSDNTCYKSGGKLCKTNTDDKKDRKRNR